MIHRTTTEANFDHFWPFCHYYSYEQNTNNYCAAGQFCWCFQLIQGVDNYIYSKTIYMLLLGRFARSSHFQSIFFVCKNLRHFSISEQSNPIQQPFSDMLHVIINSFCTFFFITCQCWIYYLGNYRHLYLRDKERRLCRMETINNIRTAYKMIF